MIAQACHAPTVTEFRGMNCWEADMLLAALAEQQRDVVDLQVALAKIAGGAQVL